MPLAVRRRRPPGRPPGKARLAARKNAAIEGDLVAQVIGHLREQIVAGSYPAGMSLPSEGRLAESLAVSRTVIREAMRSLRSQGLIVMSQGARPRVAHVDSGPTAEALSLLLQRSQTTLLQLTEARRPLESAIAWHAAARATAGQVAALEQSVDDLRRAKTLEARVAADLRFHSLLAEASGNPVFAVLLDTLGRLLVASRKRTIRAAGPQPAIEGHAAILAAVARRDPAAAEAAMLEHLAWAEDHLRNVGRSRLSQRRATSLTPEHHHAQGRDH
jgi:DNA-binding FadR family transcriptional regulator